MREPATTVARTDLVQGGSLLLAARIVTVMSGFLLYWGLALIFTTTLGQVEGTAAFGVWGATFGIINPISAMAFAGTLQVMSRVIATRGEASAFRYAARSQLVLILAIAVAFELAAGVIASRVLNDPSYALPLRLAAAVPVFYAWRALYEGYLNGSRRFREQAILDIATQILRVALILVGAVVAAVLGAIGGLVVAAAVMAAVAHVWVRPERSKAAQVASSRELWIFQAQVIGVTFATQYLLNLDLIAVKALASDVPEVADRFAGYYTAAQRIAQVPLSLIVAFPYLMFSYVASGDAQVARVVRLGMRAVLLVIAPAAVILGSNAHETLALVFPTLARTVAEAGDPVSAFAGPLRLLALGYVPFALFYTSNMLLTAGGRPGLAGAIAGVTLGVAFVAVRILTPELGPEGAASGAALGWLLGLAASGLALLRLTGGFVPPLSAARIAACAGVTWWVSSWITTSGLWLLAEDAMLAALYLALLFATRELGLDEVRSTLRSLVPSR